MALEALHLALSSLTLVMLSRPRPRVRLRTPPVRALVIPHACLVCSADGVIGELGSWTVRVRVRVGLVCWVLRVQECKRARGRGRKEEREWRARLGSTIYHLPRRRLEGVGFETGPGASCLLWVGERE